MAEKYSITKKEQVYNLLKNKRNFEFMSESLLRQLLDVMKVVRFREERMLIKQGAENAFCYIIIRGSVSVYVDGKFLYKLRRTGDVFGEISFVTQSISTATIKAEKDLGVMVISYNFFNKLKNIELALWLARVIGEKLVRTSKIKSESTPVAIEEQNNQSDSSVIETENPEEIEAANPESDEMSAEAKAIPDEINANSENEIDQASPNNEDYSEQEPTFTEQDNDSTPGTNSKTAEDESFSEQETSPAEPSDDSQAETNLSENDSEEIEPETTSEEVIDLDTDILE